MVETETGSSAEVNELPFAAPCRQLQPLAPLGWLARGWQDMRVAPTASLSYGIFMAATSMLLSGFAYVYGSYWLLFALLSGFVFVAPVLCIGLYAISAQLERGDPPSLLRSLREAGRRRLGNELVFALVLLVIFLVWARAGSMVHVFFPVEANPDWRELAAYLGIGSAVGSIFAAITFAASAFSLPMIMHRNVDAVTAVVTSINAVLRNKAAMAVWIALIVLAIAVGFATFFVGLAVTLPLIGHATWHGYLATIDASVFPRHAQGVAATPRPRNVGPT
jgi:uncharacterized membrane protein